MKVDNVSIRKIVDSKLGGNRFTITRAIAFVRTQPVAVSSESEEILLIIVRIERYAVTVAVAVCGIG